MGHDFYPVKMLCAVLLIGATPVTAGSTVVERLAVQELALGDNWHPTENSYWLDDATVAVIAERPGSQGADYALILTGTDRAPETVLMLDGPGHCLLSTGALLLRDEDGNSLRWQPDATEATDPGALDHCLNREAEMNMAMEPRVGRQAALATNGQVWAGLTEHPQGAELLLYDEQDVLGQWQSDVELMLDPVSVQPMSTAGFAAGHFLVYPAWSGRRRADFRTDLPGIPVWDLSVGQDPVTSYVPWAEWNAKGSYHIDMTRDGLIFATSGGTRDTDDIAGIYTETSDWTQIHSTDLLPETLKVSPDGCHLFWVEQPDGSEAPKPRLMTASICLN